MKNTTYRANIFVKLISLGIFNIIIMSLLLMAPNVTKANNLEITNVTMASDSVLQFSISWENSWRSDNQAPYNHDAIWIFVKYKDCASGQWQHMDLSKNVADHTAGAGLEMYIDTMDTGNNASGIFIRRDADGVGNISSTVCNVLMKEIVPLGAYDFKVLGIEMVQITKGNFFLGDGVSTYHYKTGSTSVPYEVTSESITVGSSGTGLWATAYTPSAMPYEYPKGHKEFYCMKYELSQGAWVEFINLLTSDQAAVREFTYSASRINISDTWPNQTTTTPHRPVGNLGWADLIAYLDWAALRPMTDLEYEKICRGPNNSVQHEKAWGTEYIQAVSSANLVNDGLATEYESTPITAGYGPANYNNTLGGVIRCGAFAKNATTREEAGATYFGVMEMSGSLHEKCVNTNSAGVSYQGNVGDGELSTSPSAGYADQPSWPSPTAGTGGTSSATGMCIRGACFATAISTAQQLSVSDRINARHLSTYRHQHMGGRGVR